MKFLLISILSLLSVTYSQELNCRVTVNFESLPVENREILNNFSNTVEDYMNKTRFTDRWEGDKIDCSMDIFFLSSADELNYTAQVFIGSKRPIFKSINNSPMITILDDSWSFTYEKDQALLANQSVFDPLTSFLDYYANVIIGYDLDSWEKLAGSDYFSKAIDIVNLGATSRHSKGWQSTGSSFTYNRRGFVEDLLNEKYRPFREAFFDYHYNGIDMYSEKPDAALENIAKLVNTLELIRNKRDLNSVLIKAFFNAKHGEVIDYLKNYNDKSIFKILTKVDPAHASKYDEAFSAASN
jgi:hypothetical protein